MPRKCIFCGDKDMSLEHVVSDWASELIATTKPAPSQPGNVVAGKHRRWTEGDEVDTEKEWINRKGMADFTAKCVCRRCNSGWMSNIETDAQSLLTEMILDDAITLDIAGQERVARWLGLKAVVAQFSVLPKPADKSWASAFATDKAPPQNWQIRLGRYTGESPVFFGYSKQDLTVVHRLTPVTLKRPGFLFTISMGAFVGQVFGSKDQFPIVTNRRYFIEIWPHPLLRFQSPSFADIAPKLWPPKGGLDDAQLKKCSQNSSEPALHALVLT